MPWVLIIGGIICVAIAPDTTVAGAMVGGLIFGLLIYERLEGK
jgi:hypothetical protein